LPAGIQIKGAEYSSLPILYFVFNLLLILDFSPSCKVTHDKTYTFSVFILNAMPINLMKDISAATNVDAAFKTFSKNFNLPIWFFFPFLFSQYHLI